MWRSSIRKLLPLVIFIIALAAATVYAEFVLSPFPSSSVGYAGTFRYIYAGIILVGGVLFSRELAKTIARDLKSRLGNNAFVLSNVVAVGGYIVSGAVAASYASFSPTALIAGAAFSGLVLGLALQPTLGSFFAGILLLVSGAIRPGSQVRILTWHFLFRRPYRLDTSTSHLMQSMRDTWRRSPR